MKPTANTTFPTLDIRAFGEPRVLVNGQAAHWQAQGAQELLFALLSLPEGASKERLMELLWGLAPDPTSNNRFRVTMHRLRTSLQWPDVVLERHGRYYLAPEVMQYSDVFVFYQALEQAERLQKQEHPGALAAYQHALSVYKGDYLPGIESEWAILAREEHKAAYVRGCLELSLLYCDAQSCEAAVGALVRGLRADPYVGENYHQKLMSCLAVVEDKYAAIEHYRRFLGFLRDELHDTPMQETRDLAETIKNGKFVCERALGRAMPQHTKSCPLTSDGQCPKPMGELIDGLQNPMAL
jgi:DNA-binding SARP family transcriptional activator